MLSKVPEITLYFWIIKVLCTTVGETASDYLNTTLNLGLTGTSIVMGAILLVALWMQFRSRKYIPGIYWLAVVLISIFGTLITDNMTDNMGISLEISTVVFSVALVTTFAIWFASEKTLSIHSIFTRRREAFYWLAILFTFALGTAAGDLMAESLGLGYLVTGIIVCAVIAAVVVAWRFNLNVVLAFWIVYILTRPLGASLGDYLSQATQDGGLGLGTAMTSVIFLSAILATVLYLAVTKRDLILSPVTEVVTRRQRYAAIIQVAVVSTILMIAAGTGYYWYQTKLQTEASASSSPTSPLGDLSSFRQITQDTLGLVRSGDLPAAKSRIRDLETAWDKAEARMKPMNPEQWVSVDKAIDKALRGLRASPQDAATCRTSLESLITMFDALDKRK